LQQTRTNIADDSDDALGYIGPNSISPVVR
jgi:hypothetical protein